MNNFTLFNKILSLPPDLKKQVLDFISSLHPQKYIDERKPRTFGSLKGKIKIKNGFDDPIEDFKEYM